MAGTVTKTEQTFGRIHKITWTWLSSAGGAADDTTGAYYTGRVVRAVQIPDGGGTAPTTLYDVVVNDADGADVLQGTGGNLNIGTNTESNDLATVATTQLTLAVTNAGNAKGGKTILYVEAR